MSVNHPLPKIKIPKKITNPAFRALIAAQQETNIRLAALTNILSPKNFIMDIKTLAKTSTFTDTEVECGGADLIQISTDGDLTDVSYKVVQNDGSTSLEMEASESPHVPGKINALLITNDTVEGGKTIRIARFQASQGVLPAIQHGTPTAISIASGKRLFYAEIEEFTTGADNFFETDQDIIGGTVPTLSFVGAPAVQHIMIHEIRHQITPTAAETYRLWLFEAASANDEQMESEIIYDSGAGIAGSAIVKQVSGGSPAKLPTMARLTTGGTIYYALDWSGAPGNSTGYIKVIGEVLG